MIRRSSRRRSCESDPLTRREVLAPARQGCRDRAALLVDLLEHEGLEAVLLAAILVPVDDGRRGAVWEPVEVEYRHLVRAQHGDLAIVQDRHLASVRQERRDRRRDELLPVSQSDDERAFAPDADQRVGFLIAHRDERVVAGQLLE